MVNLLSYGLKGKFFLASLSCILIISSNAESLSREEYSKLKKIDEKIEKLYLHYPDSALRYINEAFEIIELNNNSLSGIIWANFYLYKGVVIRYIDANQSVDCLFKAMQIYEKADCKQGKANAYGALGSLEHLEPERQLRFLKNALRLYKELSKETGQPNTNIGTMYNNIGLYFIRQGMMDSARYYLSEAIRNSKSVNNKGIIALATCNLGQIEIDAGSYEEALNYYREGLKALPQEDKIYSLAIKQGLIEIFLEVGKQDSAFYIYDQIKNELHLRPDIQEKTYQLLTQYFKESGDFEKALLYTNKADSVEDVINARSDKNKLTILEMESSSKVKDAVVKSLNAQMENARNTRIFLIILLFLAILIMYQQRQKGRKKREAILQKKKRVEAEKKLMAAELKNAEIERQYLNDELNHTNKELTSFATNIVQNHTMLNELRTKIQEVGRENSAHAMRGQLKELNIMLLQVFNNNEQRKEFIEKSRQINHSLIFYLKTHFKNLTDSDINLLILLMLKFTAKDIAALYNIETMSAKKKRYRLRKKLGLGDEDTMEEFFDKILNEAKLKITG